MKLAIFGLGVVGSGVLKVIQDNADLIERRTGEKFEVTHIFAASVRNLHNADLDGITITDDLDEVLNSGIDIAIEVMGGVDFPYQVHKACLERGIHVVSANKDMLAQHVDELSQIANENNARLLYEASSGGGVPIFNGLKYGLGANRISKVLGILNGTTNYILTKMTYEGLDYNSALAQAQELGYAESDPTNDVEGFDAQRKLLLLSRMAYDTKIDLDDIKAQGISQVDVKDIEIALENGYIVKLLGQSEFSEGQLSMSVAPMFVPTNHQLSHVNNAMNAIYVEGDAIGETMFYGPGAGSLETASAVVSDMMNLANPAGDNPNLVPQNNYSVQALANHAAYYLRFADENASNYLNDKGVSVTKLKADEYAVISEEIGVEVFQDIVENLKPLAAYQLINN